MSIKNQKSLRACSATEIKNFLWLLCLILCGCITEYLPTGIDEVADILVVEGIITDDESYITLSRSVTLTDEEDSKISKNYINDAKVYIECEDGTQWEAEPFFNLLGGSRDGQYTIKTGKLDLERQYRLKIEIDEKIDRDCEWYPWNPCPTETVEYRSEYSYPIQTPEIDSIFWTKRGRGQPVMIYLATHEPEGKVLYYQWSYREDWEIRSNFYSIYYPYYCWNTANNRDILLGSAEKTVFGKITDIITEIYPTNKKLSVLYRIDVKQNAISKRAYDYFANIKKNAQQSGSIFAPIPSELRGNISCITDPGRPVIGYVDISTTTKTRRYIPVSEGVYERPIDCIPFSSEELGDTVPAGYISVGGDAYVPESCVNCTYYGTQKKPDDWPITY